MKKINKKPFSRCSGPSYAGWIDSKTGRIPLETHIEGTKKYPTGDDSLLRFLVFCYEKKLKEKGPKEAEYEFWRVAKGLLDEGVLTSEEWHILCDAEVAGSLGFARVESDNLTFLKSIKSVQTLVKANPNALKLPFVRDAMICFLQNYKYIPSIKGGSILQNLKDEWFDFVPKRPKGKVLYSPESLRRLVEEGKKAGERPLDVNEVVGKAFEVSDSKIQEITANKGEKGRPKRRNIK